MLCSPLPPPESGVRGSQGMRALYVYCEEAATRLPTQRQGTTAVPTMPASWNLQPKIDAALALIAEPSDEEEEAPSPSDHGAKKQKCA